MEHNPLAEIRSVEKEAQEKIAASQKEAQRIVKAAREEAEAFFAQAVAAAKKEGEELVAKIVSETEAQLAAKTAPISQLQDHAEERMDQAVAQIIKRIKERKKRWH